MSLIIYSFPPGVLPTKRHVIYANITCRLVGNTPGGKLSRVEKVCPLCKIFFTEVELRLFMFYYFAVWPKL